MSHLTPIEAKRCMQPKPAKHSGQGKRRKRDNKKKSKSKLPDLLKAADDVAGRWRVVRKIGQGGFGQVYSVRSLSQDGLAGALKLEPLAARKQLLKGEVSLLKAVGNNVHVPALLDYGRGPSFNFVVMSLLGQSLSALRKSRPTGTLTAIPGLDYAVQMLAAIQWVHCNGFIHRDIKPSNFVLDEAQDRVLLIDFGLARKYVLKNGEHRPSRASLPGFRGTARYASVNTHDHGEMSRRDDLWCFFFSLVELLLGPLPWHKEKDKQIVADMKRAYLIDLEEGTQLDALPGLCLVLDSITRLEYEDRPDYEFISAMLKKVRAESELPVSSYTADDMSASLSTDSLPSAAEVSVSIPNPPPEDDEDMACEQDRLPSFSSDHEESSSPVSCIDLQGVPMLPEPSSPVMFTPIPPSSTPPVGRIYRKRRYHEAQDRKSSDMEP